MSANYTTLVGAKTLAGSIKHFTNYSRIDSESVLEDAQRLLYQTLRITEMKARATLTLAVGDTTEPLPTGFLGFTGKGRDTAGNRYEHVVEQDVFEDARIYDGSDILSGQPSCFCVFDAVINFDLKFDTASTIFVPYYRSLPLLSGSNETNFLTDRFPHLLKQACHVSSHAFMKNWTAYNSELPLLTSLIERANSESDLMFIGAAY
jgi:hypothetical protein